MTSLVNDSTRSNIISNSDLLNDPLPVRDFSTLNGQPLTVASDPACPTHQTTSPTNSGGKKRTSSFLRLNSSSSGDLRPPSKVHITRHPGAQGTQSDIFSTVPGTLVPGLLPHTPTSPACHSSVTLPVFNPVLPSAFLRGCVPLPAPPFATSPSFTVGTPKSACAPSYPSGELLDRPKTTLGSATVEGLPSASSLAKYSVASSSLSSSTSPLSSALSSTPTSMSPSPVSLVRPGHDFDPATLPVHSLRETTPPPLQSAPSPSADSGYEVSTDNPHQQRKIADYELLVTLGTGTFGRVYLCRLRNSSEYYAMKVLRKVDVVKLKQVEHINSEREILSQIRFPFIVNLYTTFQNEVNLYMLQEYVVGGELFSHLRKAGRFPNDVTRFYAAEIILAIEYLHSKDIIYRDLKPENLLLDSSGHIKITDFGFAKHVADRTWTLCGTPEYLAPEIIQSKGHGKAVDWWALGILVFEMLAGYPPFFDDNPFGIYEKILAGRIAFPAHFDVSAKDLIRRLLTADRTKRLGNLKDGAKDIKQHRWFRSVCWDDLQARRVNAPIVPPYRHLGDTGNFDRYPEPSGEPNPEPGVDPFRSFFPDF
ncbi:cytochrome c oxidase subunit 1 [Dispira simplex]|nr:cytochrome c oxidase subunit 1 [Dispira simplex]